MIESRGKKYLVRRRASGRAEVSRIRDELVVEHSILVVLVAIVHPRNLMIGEPLEERRHVHHAGAAERLLLAPQQRFRLLLLPLPLVPKASKESSF